MKVTIGLKQYILIITGVVIIVIAAPHVFKHYIVTTWKNDAEFVLAIGVGILTGGLLSMFSDTKRKKQGGKLK